MGKFIVKKTPTGVKFDLLAGNGQVIATSQVYASRATCINGIHSVQKNAEVALTEDQTKEGFTPHPHPKFEVYLDKQGDHRFRLTARNGQIIASSEPYTTRKACLNGIASVVKNAPGAPIEDE